MLRAGTHAVGGPGGETGVTDTADLLVTLRIGECKDRFVSCWLRIAQHESHERNAEEQQDKPPTDVSLLRGTIYPHLISSPTCARPAASPPPALLLSLMTISRRLTLYLLAKTFNEGSMIPPRRRRTKCKVDSFWML